MVIPFFVLPFVISGMKHPFSATSRPDVERSRSGEQMDSDAEDPGAVVEQQSPGGALHSSLFKPKRERKQRTYTLCDVCNIQLNSAAQAQVHYSGKSHQKRLKKISNGKMPTSTGRPPGAAGISEAKRERNPGLPLSYADLTQSHTHFLVECLPVLLYYIEVEQIGFYLLKCFQTEPRAEETPTCKWSRAEERLPVRI